jgi:hypothetical protein
MIDRGKRNLLGVGISAVRLRVRGSQDHGSAKKGAVAPPLRLRFTESSLVPWIAPTVRTSST